MIIKKRSNPITLDELRERGIDPTDLYDNIYKCNEDSFVDSEQLRMAAIEKDLTVPQLSRETGICKGTISRMLNGECKYNQLAKLCALCEAVGLFPVITLVKTKGGR